MHRQISGSSFLVPKVTYISYLERNNSSNSNPKEKRKIINLFSLLGFELPTSDPEPDNIPMYYRNSNNFEYLHLSIIFFSVDHFVQFLRFTFFLLPSFFSIEHIFSLSLQLRKIFCKLL